MSAFLSPNLKTGYYTSKSNNIYPVIKVGFLKKKNVDHLAPASPTAIENLMTILVPGWSLRICGEFKCFFF